MRFKKYINESSSTVYTEKVKKSDLSNADWKKLDKYGNFDESLPFLIKILKKKGYTYKGKTPGKYSSEYWTKKGEKWRNTGDFELYDGGFIDMELILMHN